MKREITIATAECHTCGVTVGPDRTEDIGEKLYRDHAHHDVTIEEETEVHVVECAYCDREAVEKVEKGTSGSPRTAMVPVCEKHNE